MSKQDRQGVRRAADIEQKYDLSKLSKLSGGGTINNEQLSQLNQQLSQFMVSTNAKIEALQLAYGVGAVYISLIDTNPSALFGGTWELMSNGYLLVGLDPESEDVQNILQYLDKCYIWKRTT